MSAAADAPEERAIVRVVVLFRPVGLAELRLIYEAQMRGFPPRLPEQPIFYPVLNEPYAQHICREWNATSHEQAGFVTRFAIDDAYATRFPRKIVGSREHEELWVPAEELAEFNTHLRGPIEVIDAAFGPGFVGVLPDHGALKGQDARAQLLCLLGLQGYNLLDFTLEVLDNHTAVFLHFFLWEQLDLSAQGVSPEACDALLPEIRRVWKTGSRAAISLGLTPY